MSDEIMAIRKELYFAIGNCCNEMMLGDFNAEGQRKVRAKEIANFMLQFGTRTNLISSDECKDLIGLLADDGSGCGVVFEKHGHLDEAASSLAAMFNGPGKCV